MRVFGPVDPRAPGKPTDDADHPCEQKLKLTAVDADSLSLEGGRWFFTETACEGSRDPALAPGCVATAALAP